MEVQKDALDIFDRLEDNLRRLKQNEENVGRDRLRIRFKKAYDRLLNDIRLEANEVVRLVVLGGLIFRNGSEKASVIRKIGQAVQTTGLVHEARSALSERYSALEFYGICDQLRAVVLDEYRPYFLRQCSDARSPETGEMVPYSSLLRMYWEPESKTWNRYDSEGHVIEFRLGPEGVMQ